uniref:Uncharacterized protein n=2 Tax=Sar TaxID=2698737 RepID=A0A7S3LQI4_9STRA|mmetsp:Transcript_1327/g.1703  ORF Transcript_1327/g.1703 Transcript_1327/m.1703 type:complete len:345 (+) Transcript_1327:248-1282(+)
MPSTSHRVVEKRKATCLENNTTRLQEKKSRLLLPRTTPYEVFMSFVKYDDQGNCETEHMVSKKCFDTWLATRLSLLRNPEESFRRSLLGHVIGSERRKPFPPDIEESLLIILRKPEVWQCFRGTDCKIGLRGFRNRGYHECLGISGTVSNIMNDIPWYQAKETYLHPSEMEYRLISNVLKFVQWSTDSSLLRGRLAKSIIENIAPDAFFGLLRQIGPDYFNSFTESGDTDKDFTLEGSFLMPGNIKFGAKLTGTLILDETFRILDSFLDDHILGESVRLKNWIGMSASCRQAVLFIIHMLPPLKRDGSVTGRNVIRLSNNEKKILLFKWKQASENISCVTFQES